MTATDSYLMRIEDGKARADHVLTECLLLDVDIEYNHELDDPKHGIGSRFWGEFRNGELWVDVFATFVRVAHHDNDRQCWETRYFPGE